MKISNHINYCIIILVGCCTIGFSGCKSFIEVDPPNTSTNAGNVYAGDATATAVLTGIFITLAGDENQNVGIGGLSVAPALSADEFAIVEGLPTDDVIGYYKNALNAARLTSAFSGFWGRFYSIIFNTNSAIEGLNSSEKLTPKIKAQLLGEAHFIRAFIYFQLVNLYGDVPLILTTDYKANGGHEQDKYGTCLSAD